MLRSCSPEHRPWWGQGVSHPENLSKGTAAGSLETFSLLGTLESPGNTLDWIPQEAQWEVEIQEEFSPPRLQPAATCLTPLVWAQGSKLNTTPQPLPTQTQPFLYLVTSLAKLLTAKSLVTKDSRRPAGSLSSATLEAQAPPQSCTGPGPQSPYAMGISVHRLKPPSPCLSLPLLPSFRIADQAETSRHWSQPARGCFSSYPKPGEDEPPHLLHGELSPTTTTSYLPKPPAHVAHEATVICQNREGPQTSLVTSRLHLSQVGNWFQGEKGTQVVSGRTGTRIPSLQHGPAGHFRVCSDSISCSF